MADSRRERILKAIAAALAQPSVTIDGVVHTKPTGLNVHRQRRRSIETDTLPATIPYLLEEAVALEEHAPVAACYRVARIRLEHRALGAPEDAAVDPLVSWGTKVLIADPTLGGLANAIEEKRLEWDGEEMDEDFAACGQDFEVEFSTPEHNPEG
jgi:hypothetical protein